MPTLYPDPLARVAELLAIWSGPDVSAAQRLCDQHDPAASAYRLIAADLSAHDLSYADLRRDSERFAAVLRAQGVKPGERVATLMGKSRHYLVALMGIWRLGAVHVPLFTAFAPPAIRFRLDGSGARLVVCDQNQQHKLAPGDHMPAEPAWSVITTGEASGGSLGFDALMAEAEPGFPAAAMGGNAPLIHIYTSGTTGNPKGVIVPIRALAAFQAYAEFGLGIRAEDDVYWCAADPGWAYGLYYGVLATFLTGTRSVMLEAGFTPDVTMAVLEREGVTNFSAAPTVYRALRSAGLPHSDTLRLRCASSAGEPLTPEVNAWAVAELGVEVHDHYGQTEIGMVINNHHHPAVRRPIVAGSMGQAMPGWTAAILQEERDEPVAPGVLGRVAMDLSQSPLSWFSGYYGDADKTAEKFTADGRWYVSGDTGLVDENGYFCFSARDDDVIIMAGYRIGPFEVESVMATHPAISESAVIAVPDEVRGEVMEAYVVLREAHEAGPELEQDIQQWVKRNYAAHAYPRSVHFIGALPKTPSGKVQRFLLKQQRMEEIAAGG